MSKMPDVGDGQPLPDTAPPGDRSNGVNLLGYCLLTDKQLKQFYELQLISDEELSAAGMELIGDHGLRHKRSRVRVQPNTHDADSGKDSRRVNVLGYCLLTDKQLKHYYSRFLISDEELIEAGIDPTSVGGRISIADELRSMTNALRRITNELREMGDKSTSRIFELTSIFDEHSSIVPKRPQESPLSEDLAEQVLELQSQGQGIRPQKSYEFQPLNQLVEQMGAEPDPRAIFPESQFDLDAIYWEGEREKVRRLEPKERQRRQFDAFYDYLEEQFMNGDRDKVIDLVEDAFLRLSKRRLEDGQGPTASDYMSPRSCDLIPPQQEKVADEACTSTELVAEIQEDLEPGFVLSEVADEACTSTELVAEIQEDLEPGFVLSEVADEACTSTELVAEIQEDLEPGFVFSEVADEACTSTEIVAEIQEDLEPGFVLSEVADEACTSTELVAEIQEDVEPGFILCKVPHRNRDR